MRLTSLLVCLAGLLVSGCSSSAAESVEEASSWPFPSTATFDDSAREHLGFLQRIAADAEVARAAAAAGQQAADDDALAAAAAASAASAPAATDVRPLSPEEECIGYGCSPEQDAEINAAESAANDDYGPGCDYRLCGESDSYPSFACDAGADGLPVCEGEVPASVGPYRTPDGTLMGG